MPKCPHCPVADRPCLAETTGHRRYCELIDPDSPSYEPGYLAIVAATPTTGPSLLRKAANFGKAIVTHAVAGLPQVDDTTYEARLAICRACMFFTPEPMTCLKCGCDLNIKIRWADQHCPIGKW
jgi:hypothetical protein